MNDWITHDGGPCPVAPDTIVDVVLNGQYGVEIAPWRADGFVWDRAGSLMCVKAYRLAQPEPAACEHDWDYRGTVRFCRKCSTLQKQEPLARDMTKRERFAMAAMQGLLADPNCSTDRKAVATASIEYADALLAALEVKRDA